jgi:hypothetical protein
MAKFVKAKDNPDFENRAELSRQGLPVNRIKNKDGSTSTHKMESGEVDGKDIAYPTIVNKGGKLKQLKTKEAQKYALKTGEYKKFDNPEESQEYAEGSWKDKHYKAKEIIKNVMMKKYLKGKQ